MGFTDQMLGDFFGVNESTINRWKLEHEEFVQAIHVGKDVADDAVERAVFLRIIGFTRKEQKLVGSSALNANKRNRPNLRDGAKSERERDALPTTRD